MKEDYIMAENSQFSFNRPYKPFGFNIQVPERTIQQAGQSLENLIKAPTEPLFNFLEENENVFPGEVYRIEAVLSAKFAHKTNVSQGETQKRLGVDINTGPEYPNSTIDISYTKDGIHVEGKTGNGNSQTSVSFDIVGTKDGIKNSKIQNLNINNKKTESVGYSATADNISTVIEYGDRIIYRGSVSDGMKLENVRNDVPDETYTYIDDPTNSVTVEIHYR